MHHPSATDRRSFLKTGAIAATPFAIMAPAAAAMGDDGSRARLARLEDERAIDALHRAFLRRFNTAGAADCGELLAQGCAVQLDADLRLIADDPAHEPALELAEDGMAAQARHACRVEIETQFTGDTTLERMARLQGQGSHRRSEARELLADYVKDRDGWRIARLRMI